MSCIPLYMVWPIFKLANRLSRNDLTSKLFDGNLADSRQQQKHEKIPSMQSYFYLIGPVKVHMWMYST